MIRLVALLALVLITVPARATSILDTDLTAAAIARGALVWDARDTASYRQGHLPGAVTVAESERIFRLPVAQETHELTRVEKSLAEAGLDLDREIVVYATRGSPLAYAALVALRYFGAKRVAVFHDGIEGWRDAGRAVETGETRHGPIAVRIVPDAGLTISTEELLARLSSRDVQILDVRTAAEYSGTDVRAARGGHVPGAINIPFEENWVDPDSNLKLARRQVSDTKGMALRPFDELRRLYGRLDPGKETIVYCQTGGRAAETVGVLHELGFSRVRLYKASWSVYAARTDTPVASGAAAVQP